MDSSEDIYGICDWCGFLINHGNAQVTVTRNIEQVGQDADAGIAMIESNVLLTLCARCGNRLDQHALQSLLRTLT
jgi:hypothetical protein